MLEHTNFNVGDVWDANLDRFFFEILGLVLDPRGHGVNERTQAAGGAQLDLRWANCGFQQFHLPVVSELAYASDEYVEKGLRNWSYKQALFLAVTICGYD